MIAQNEEPGRNDPCPCGSGHKYKKCCLPKKHQATRAQLAAEIFKLRKIVHMTLVELQKVTGADHIVVSKEKFDNYPGNLRWMVMDDTENGVVRFKAEMPPEKKVIQPQRRIILPK